MLLWMKERSQRVCVSLHFTLCMLMNKNHYTHTVWTAAREPGYFGERKIREQKSCRQKENNTQDSNVVPHRSTNWARACLTSLSRREAVLSCWYGRSHFSYKYLRYIKNTTKIYCTQFLLYPVLSTDKQTNKQNIQITKQWINPYSLLSTQL